MSKVIAIEGGYKLNGTVRISGAKNATVALIPAAVLADGPVEILGVPEISDVEALAILLKELNCDVDIKGDSIRIDPSQMKDIPLVSDAVNKLRASYYFMGALLGKYKRVKIKMPGGCYLGPRPIDLHLKGFKALGANITYDEVEETYLLEADELIGNSIYLDFASVGATINILLAAVKAKGRTIIENAAKEPEIIDVTNLLTKMGAHIRGVGTDTITIDGVDHLHGTFHEIIPDRIEAGTFLIIAAAAGEKVIIQNVIPQHLEALISKLKEMGVQMDVVGDSIIVYGSQKPLKPVHVKTQIYPGFATDLQQPLTALLTQADGKSSVKETIYIERFLHCEQLNKMGAHIEVGRASSMIYGSTKLHGARVQATDLRCGAALIIAGLIAEGKTEIMNVYHIDRGYDNIDQKLITLGAHMTRYEIDA
ncbi:MAG: UDP-N-acetylglucosamine 1-carboxyvinyltransferase [Erysipelotrichaceae bacterium]|nr:UDP-N-acetylglucosamine 1-carboxyvinyltransferase [Erysipelotrichaceae bacterium]